MSGNFREDLADYFTMGDCRRAKRLLFEKSRRCGTSVLMLSTAAIKANWEHIKVDPYNNRPDIETAEEYIAQAVAGKVTAGGVQVVVNDMVA